LIRDEDRVTRTETQDTNDEFIVKRRIGQHSLGGGKRDGNRATRTGHLLSALASIRSRALQGLTQLSDRFLFARANTCWPGPIQVLRQLVFSGAGAFAIESCANGILVERPLAVDEGRKPLISHQSFLA
jgi:hypothetical protein